MASSASKIAIVNISLVQIGADQITSIDENSKNARVANAVYDYILDEVLRSHYWNFAIKRQAIARLSETPAFEYTYYHQLPSDYLRLVYIKTTLGSSTTVAGGQLENFRVEANKIASDYDTLYMKYVSRVTDTIQFDPAFVQAFATRLSAEIAYNITGNLNVSNMMMESYIEKLRSAKGQDAQETGYEELEANEWLASRNYGKTGSFYTGAV